MINKCLRSVATGIFLAGCGGGAPADNPTDGSTPTGPKLQIVTVDGSPLHAVAGDAMELKVVLVGDDGAVADLPAGATVTWTSPGVVTALSPDSTDASPIPAPGSDPTAAWVSNPGRPDDAADLPNVLFVFDPGTSQNASLQVSAAVTGVAGQDSVTVTLRIDPTPSGDWTRGETLYGASGANCAECHGSTGAGSSEAAPGPYRILGAVYDYPAPGINAAPGNAAGDPAWNPALFAVALRADMDNGGLTLRAPMPDWLATPNPATGSPLTTQDIADIFAFLKTQTQ